MKSQADLDRALDTNGAIAVELERTQVNDCITTQNHFFLATNCGILIILLLYDKADRDRANAEKENIAAALERTQVRSNSTYNNDNGAPISADYRYFSQ